MSDDEHFCSLLSLEATRNPPPGDAAEVVQLDVAELLIIGDVVLQVEPHGVHVATVDQLVETDLLRRPLERLRPFVVALVTSLVAALLTVVRELSVRE